MAEKPEDKKFVGRRAFLRGGMGMPSLAAAASGGASKPDDAKALDLLLRLEKTLGDGSKLSRSLEMTEFSFTHLKRNPDADLAEPGKKEHLIKVRLNADDEKKMEDSLAQAQSLYRELNQVLGNNLVCTHGGGFIAQVKDEQNVIKPELVSTIFNGRIKQLQEVLSYHKAHAPLCVQRIEQEAQTLSKLIDVYRKTTPYMAKASDRAAAPGAVDEAKAMLSAGQDWVEVYQDPANLQRLEQRIIAAPQEREKWQKESRERLSRLLKRQETQANPDRIQGRVQEYTLLDSKAYYSKGKYYVETISPSDEFYDVLHHMASTLNVAKTFPSRDALFRAVVERDDEGRPRSFAPVGFQRPNGYVAILPHEIAESLMRVAQGEPDIPRDEDKKTGDYMERKGKIYLSLAKDLKKLDILMSGKWSSRVSDNTSDEKLQR